MRTIAFVASLAFASGSAAYASAAAVLDARAEATIPAAATTTNTVVDGERALGRALLEASRATGGAACAAPIG
jgi:hypothetical protein